MLPRNAQSVSEQKKRLEAAEIARSLSGHDRKNPGTEALGGAKIQKCSLWVCAHRRPTVGGAVKPWFSLSGKSLAMKLAVHTNYTTCCRGGQSQTGESHTSCEAGPPRWSLKCLPKFQILWLFWNYCGRCQEPESLRVILNRMYTEFFDKFHGSYIPYTDFLYFLVNNTHIILFSFFHSKHLLSSEVLGCDMY